MENKTNLILGLNGIIVVWLLFLTFKVFSGGVSGSDLASAKERAALAANGGSNSAAVANNMNMNGPNNQTISTKIDPNNPTPSITPNGQNPQQTPQPTIDPATVTTMQFEESLYDFGTLQEGDKATHMFKFKNTGDKPLTISNARGSCGCTVPQWPKEPIPPGGQGEIKVEFNSKGKKGTQTKYVTITANTNPADTKLTITSEVIALEGEGEDEK